MESASQSDKPPQSSSSKIATVVGTFVAFITLVFPLIMVSYFSSQETEALPRVPYPLSRLNRD